MQILPYYIPYNISDHKIPVTLILRTDSKSYTSIDIDFDDGNDVVMYNRNFNIISYTYQNSGTHTIQLSAYHSGGVTVQLANINIYDDFDMHDTSTFADHISATTNNYSLPYKYRDLVQSNDWVTADNINSAIYNLNENFKYLESLCHRPDLRGTETLVSWLGGPSLDWYNIDYFLLGNNTNDFITTIDSGNTLYNNNFIQINSTGQENLSTGYLSAVGFVNIVDVAVKDDNGLGNLLYVIDGTRIICLSSDITATKLLDTDKIQFNKSFTTPNSIDVDSIGNIYVVDSSNNELYKFRRVNDRIILQNAIGGQGDITDKHRFSTATHVRIDSTDRIILSDRDNYAIKIYDNLINWVQTINIGTSRGKVMGLAVNKKDDSITVVTSNKYIIHFDSNGNEIYTTQSNILPASGILQSFIDFTGNYLYVISLGVVYKYTRGGLFLKTLDVPISDNTNANLIVSGRCDNHNQSFIASKTKIFRIDSTPPIVSIKPYTDTQYYTFDDIKIGTKEGVEDWVYNNAISKLIHNHIVFSRNIVSVFNRGVSSANKLIRFDISNRPYTDIITFPVSNDMLIGMNEPVLVNVVNRALGEIYKFQETVLDAISPRILLVYDVPPVL